MMSPGHKIHLLFVTAIMLMLGSHALLPHHHHFDSHYSHNYPLPVDSKHDHNESDNPATHCHAFNHLLDNGYHHKLIQFIQIHPLLAPVITEGFPPILKYTIIRRELPDHKIIAQGYDHSYSLRDPPAPS